jgi:TetR/AcrR family transcriptional regulator, transcriptional repressor for nem operon
MGSKGDANRRRIVDAADQLFYRQGYNRTSFSDIAQAAALSRGNFYYYFKSKDEILSAVIERRREGIVGMLAEWSRGAASPRERLRRFVQMLLNNRDDLLRYGCPIGSLTLELAKTQREQHDEAGAVFEVFRTWLAAQFADLSHVEEADELACHLLVLGQGVSLLAAVYGDTALIEREVARIDAWLDGL